MRRIPLARLRALNSVAAACLVAASMASLSSGAHAQDAAATGSGALTGTNTMNILTSTVQALPSCLAYQVTGVCFFLKCTIVSCDIETSIRISHYVPDVIISTYNEPKQHPWTDIGKPIAVALEKAGSSMMSSLLDSSANTARESQEVVTFKSTDAISNPVGGILAGGGTFEFADFSELMDFPGTELPKILQQWAMVPVDLGNGILEGARATAMNPGALLGDISSLPGQFGGMLGNMGNLGQLGLGNFTGGLSAGLGGGQSGGAGAGSATGTGSTTGAPTAGGTEATNGTGSTAGSGGAGSSSAGGTGTTGSTSGDSGNGTSSAYSRQLDQIYQALGQAGANSSRGNNGSGSGSSGQSAYICPGDGGMLSIHYNADLDSVFWRGKVPLELLYPGSWVPGVGEVGHSLINTWGGTYPRTGELVQSHPVKASAVLAARVASIIRQPAQPHIYKKLSVKAESKYVYFKRGVDPMWQAVYPVPDSKCITFGENDSLSLIGSYGDYKTSSTDGYIWNLWQRYECCDRKTPIFLFAVP